jgi:hypothetical protein
MMATVIQGTTGTSIGGASSTEGNFSVGGNLTVTGAIGGQLNLTAGTTLIAPLDFTAGTNLTTAIAGAMEYDGRVIYATPQGTQRGVVPGAQFFRLDSGLVGANVNTAQNIFGVGVTLSANTVYAFELYYTIAKTAGTTSHAFSSLFAGTATFNSAYLSSIYAILGAPPNGGSAPQFATITVLSAIAYFGATATANNTITMRQSGTLSVNAGGTFIPQYSLSAAPGGAYTTVAGSYMLIYPIGASGANVNVGTWA